MAKFCLKTNKFASLASIEAKTVYKDFYMVEFELNTPKGEQYFSISFAFDPSCRLAVKSDKKLPGN